MVFIYLFPDDVTKENLLLTVLKIKKRVIILIEKVTLITWKSIRPIEIHTSVTNNDGNIVYEGPVTYNVTSTFSAAVDNGGLNGLAMHTVLNGLSESIRN